MGIREAFDIKIFDGGVATAPPPSASNVQPNVPIRAFKDLTLEERWEKAYQLRLEGISVLEIARSFGVTKPTVYKWLAKATERQRNLMELLPAADYVADSLQMFSHLEQICISEIQRCRSQGLEVDPNTGDVIRVSASDPKVSETISRFVEIAANTRQKATNLMHKTGILPTAKSGSLYHNWRGESPTVSNSSQPDIERSEEELRADVEKLLKIGHKL